MNTETNKSPVSIIKTIYELASTTSYQKQACLRYLLHYQHYNAELTKDKREELGHPMPLYTDQGDPGYIRTDKQTNELARPYVKKYLRKFYKKLSVPSGNNIDEYFDKSYKLTCHSVVSILKRMSSIRIAEIGHQKSDTQVLAVYVTTNDLKLLENVDENECKTLKLIKKRLRETNQSLGAVKDKKINFLFLHGEKNIDCVLMWAAEWDSPKKSSNLKFLDIESDVFSILNKCGAFPDRLAINQFLTKTVYDETKSFQDNLEAFDIEYLNGSNQTDGPNLSRRKWNDLIKEIKNYGLEEGSKMYRDAFLKWLDIFFNKNKKIKKFAIPLLNSQVIPWISDKSTIDKWAKSYQNLCEIVVFCLDYFSETVEINQMKSENCLKSIALKLFDPSDNFENKSCHIYSYGMSSIYIVLDHILKLDKFKKQLVSVACVNQNYFETLGVIEKMYSIKKIELIIKDNLNEIEKMPDILIADIHPNNASRNRLHKNDIAPWIIKMLSNQSKTLILILDITLNNLTDEHLQSTLKDLNEFINNGKLEIFSIMSLAKLVQLGSDNFSGGLCFYLGDKNTISNLSSEFIIPQKYRFFGLLLKNFQKIIADYLKKIRENCNLMYDQLIENFNYIEKELGSCATAITVNPDESTVYVAIGFHSILDKFNEKETDKSKLFRSLIESLLKSAGKRELPITGRQSFGFPLSNMNLVGKFIRFSIGVENGQLLNYYADLITDFSHALTKYIAKIAKISSEFNIQTFLDAIDKVHDILSSKQDSITYEISYKAEETDETIKADICYGIRNDKPQLILNIQINGVNNIEICGGSIGIIKTYKDRPTMSTFKWSYKYLFMLFFHLELELQLNLQSVVVFKTSHDDRYYIEGLLNSNINLFDVFNQRKVQLKDAKTNILITFEPEFSLTQNSKEYNAKNIYVIIESFGTIPVKFTKLDKKCRIEIFTKFLNYYFNASKMNNEDDILITFKRKSLNYKKKFKELIEAGLDGFAEYLNKLNLEDLPIFENQTWEEYSTATDTLHHIYNLLGSKEVGAMLIKKFITIEKLEKIDNLKFKKNIVHGISSQIYESALIKIYIQFDDTILEILWSKKYFDYDQFKEWIIKLDGIENNTNDMNLYFEAISKIVDKFYNISQDLYNINFTTSLYNMFFHEKLKQVLKQKFKGISTFIKNKRIPQIGHYLYFYIKYWSIDGVKDSLLKAVQTIEKDKLKDWIFSPLTSLDFICYPLDSLECLIAEKYCKIVIDLKDGDKVNDFFDKLDCKSFLLEVELKSNLVFAVRWAIITKDSELFNNISEFLKTNRENLIEHQLILKEYARFLDVNDISQNKIKKKLEEIFNNS